MAPPVFYCSGLKSFFFSVKGSILPHILSTGSGNEGTI